MCIIKIWFCPKTPLKIVLLKSAAWLLGKENSAGLDVVTLQKKAFGLFEVFRKNSSPTEKIANFYSTAVKAIFNIPAEKKNNALFSNQFEKLVKVDNTEYSFILI